MSTQRFVEYLQQFGLTRQEAVIYKSLLENGKCTGYEIAKLTGVSRSNAYNSLAALTEKGAAYIVEATAKKYLPVDLKEFCDNCIRNLQEKEEWMLLNLPERKVEDNSYITIEGEDNIRDKICNLLNMTKERVYISCHADVLQTIAAELECLLKDGKKVVIITDEDVEINGAMLYHSEGRGSQIGIITDSRFVLSGEYGPKSLNTCVYSGQRNFVQVFKNALANEIKLIQYETDFKGEER